MQILNKTFIAIVATLLFSCANDKPKNEEVESVELVEQKPEIEKVIHKPDIVEYITLNKDARLIGPTKTEEQTLVDNDIRNIEQTLHPIYGYWVGMFGKNKINIAISKVDADSIFGYSVCAGNYRRIKGTFELTNPQKYSVVMNEPGDDKYDGKFEFEIDEAKGELVGKWAPFKKSTGAKEYTLEKRDFKYDPTVGEFRYASEYLLEPGEVENFHSEEIELYRNTIYARHGYSFTNLKIRRIFDQLDWYVPMSTDIRADLTDIEVANIDMMYNYEDYYEEYYNDFGR